VSNRDATVRSLPTSGLGSTGIELTRVGLGAWAIGGGGWQGGWGPQEDEESVRTIRRALDAGVNWIDTAAAYGLGHSEEVVARALADVPADERPYVFTKCGLIWDEGGTTVRNVLARESIRRECDASLRRLRVERIDLYLMHWPTWDGTPVEESWAAMAALVDEGKVRAIGLSNFDVGDLERCEAVRHVDALQPQLNMVERDAAADRIPWAAERGAGVVVYSPMAAGLLTGAFSRERAAALPEDDWRRGHSNFQEPQLSATLALVERLRPIAARSGCTLPELAIAWTLAWPGVAAAIVGARRPRDLDGWIGAAGVRLNGADLDEIAAAVTEFGIGSGPVRPAEAPVAG
jgi:aryl-alcohol dehydrogenase-like predicted oxidoreductase